MSSTQTATRYLLSNPTPATSLTAGQWYGSTHWAGIGVDTASHVRFFANGTDVAKSDLVAQAVGQVWLQSLDKFVVFAKKDVLIASHQATMIAAEGGVTFLSGFSPGAIASETTPGTFPEGITDYEAKGAIATGIWVIFDTLMAVTITAVSAILTLKDSGLSGFDAWAIEGSVANLAGAAVNLAGLSFIPWSANVSLPGINLFSQAGTLMGAAFGCTNIIGLPGTLIASTFTTQFGLLTSGVRGFKSAGMNALGPVDVTALGDVTCRGYDGATFGSRAGTTTIRGAEMIIGTEIFPWVLLPQVATTKVEFVATLGVSFESLLVGKLTAKKKVTSSAVYDTKMTAAKQADFKSGPFKISIIPTSTYLGQAGGPSVAITDAQMTMSGLGEVTKAVVADAKAELDAGGAKLTVVPGVSLTVDGVKFDLQ